MNGKWGILPIHVILLGDLEFLQQGGYMLVIWQFNFSKYSGLEIIQCVRKSTEMH